MQTQNTNRFSSSDSFRRLRATVVAVSIVVLAGCGGGGGDDEPSSPSASGGASLGDVITCVVGAIFYGVCPDATPSSGSSLSYACDDPFSLIVCMDPIPSDPTRDIYTTPVPVLDIEPNDDLATPSVATLVGGDPTLGLIGFETSGHLTAVGDRIDTYIFTAPQVLEITVQLCRQRGAQCDEMTASSGLGSMAYLEILDLNGDSIATTANDFFNGDVISMTIEAGVPYYICVVGGVWSWGSDDPLSPTGIAYYLRVVGTEPSADPAPVEPETVQPEAPQLTLTQGGTMIATLDWIAPSLNTDGTALIDLQGYVLYYGDAAGGPYMLQQPLDLGLASYTLPLPDYGEWYFAITAVNSSGVESDLSNEVVHFDPPPDMP